MILEYYTEKPQQLPTMTNRLAEKEKLPVDRKYRGGGALCLKWWV